MTQKSNKLAYDTGYSTYWQDSLSYASSYSETKRQEGDVKESSSKIQEPLSSINSLSLQRGERDKREEQRAFVRQQHVDLPKQQV